MKQEGDPNYNTITGSARSQWSSHKNPRIVRVSRSFGGKDRHSKVCTVRGLRDRRIRLSVPTAIQLYDLQDKLGLSQPSKVVDWLLDATKNDIDKLPPLPSIPGSSFTHFHQPTQNLCTNAATPSKQGMMKMSDERGEKDKWIEQETDEGFGGFVAQLSAQNLFPLGNQSSFPSMPYNPYFHWDHPNLSLSQAYPLAEDQSHNSSLLPSTSHLYFCPTATTIPAIIPSFPSYIAPSMDQNPLFSTALHLSSPMTSFALNVNSKSAQNDAGRSGKED